MPGPADRFESYIGPIARFGVFRALEPEAYVTFEIVDAKVAMEGFATGQAVQATIHRPGYTDAVGVKEIEGRKPADREKARTAAMGRALKLVGMPSKTPDLREVVNANALMWGRLDAVPHVMGAVGSLEGAEDDDDFEEDDVERAEVVASERAQAADILNGLPGELKAKYSAALRAEGITNVLQPDGRLDKMREIAARLTKELAAEEPF